MPPVKYALPPVKYAVPPVKYAVPPLKYALPPVKHALAPVKYALLVFMAAAYSFGRSHNLRIMHLVMFLALINENIFLSICVNLLNRSMYTRAQLVERCAS